MHVWVDHGLRKGVVDSVDTWQHFTFIVAVEDARSEGGGMHPKVPVTGGQKSKNKTKSMPTAAGSKKIL